MDTRDEASTARTGRGSGRGSTRTPASEAEREQELDLLTAALLGAALGAGIALLVGGVAWRQPPRSGLGHVVHGVKQTGRELRDGAAKRGRRAASLGGVVGESVRDYAERARAAIDEAVDHELRDLRRLARRQRKHLGL
jgi:hypothetical protein